MMAEERPKQRRCVPVGHPIEQECPVLLARGPCGDIDVPNSLSNCVCVCACVRVCVNMCLRVLCMLCVLCMCACVLCMCTCVCVCVCVCMCAHVPISSACALVSSALRVRECVCL